MEFHRNLVDTDTGEHLENQYTQSRNQKEQNELNRRKGYEYYKSNILPLPGMLQSEFGNFIHARYIPLLETLLNDTATAFRFIYLCTYMEYDTGYIVWKDKKITDNYLNDIFDVSRNQITKIKKILYDNNLISQDNDGHIMINTKYCYRGSITNNNDYKKEYTRIFNNSIQELYQNSGDPREHKLLGKLIFILPYINVYHNIICLNIKEKNIDKLILPNSIEMDTIFNTSERNSNKIIKELMTLTVRGEPALLNISHNMAKMYAVNPRIYYGGINVKNIEQLHGYFTARGGLG